MSNIKKVIAKYTAVAVYEINALNFLAEWETLMGAHSLIKEFENEYGTRGTWESMDSNDYDDDEDPADFYEEAVFFFVDDRLDKFCKAHACGPMTRNTRVKMIQAAVGVIQFGHWVGDVLGEVVTMVRKHH